MAQRTNFADMTCSVARAWSVIGEPWTPLIIRDLIIGLHRFDDLRADLGVSSSVLSDRLATLEASGVVERVNYKSEQRSRDEYHLTDIGKELVPVLATVMSWGDKWFADSGAPGLIVHDTCSNSGVEPVVVCKQCGDPITADNAHLIAGPGMRQQAGTLLLGLGPK